MIDRIEINFICPVCKERLYQLWIARGSIHIVECLKCSYVEYKDVYMKQDKNKAYGIKGE